MHPSPALLARLSALPAVLSLPKALPKMRMALRDPACEASVLREFLEEDPVLQRQIQQATSDQALSLWGRQLFLPAAKAQSDAMGVYRATIFMGVLQLFRNTAWAAQGEDDLLHNACKSAFATYLISRLAHPHPPTEYAPELLYLAGLLHDLGRLLLAHHFPATCVAATSLARHESISRSAAEIRLLGADHTHLGAWLGLRWDLDPEFMQAIRWHHEPTRSSRTDRHLVSLVHCAGYVCTIQQQDVEPSTILSAALNRSTWDLLGLGAVTPREVAALLMEHYRTPDCCLTPAPTTKRATILTDCDSLAASIPQ